MKLQKKRSGDQYSEHVQLLEKGWWWPPEDTTTARDDRYILPCRRKEADGNQQASFLSNSLQQRGNKCRGLLWSDAFTKGVYSPAVLNSASR
ncbi:hypothetical protein TNCV_2047911 [Trichonephila clavipes]|nr:hypothetical protein TNCV_2047911 [Trichonephila clavipes]